MNIYISVRQSHASSTRVLKLAKLEKKKKREKNEKKLKDFAIILVYICQSGTHLLNFSFKFVFVFFYIRHYGFYTPKQYQNLSFYKFYQTFVRFA